MIDPKPKSSWVYLATVALLATINIGVHWEYVVDDAISFRYAQNIAEGRGPVFNVGEKVEGYSNPLWVGLLSLCDLAGIELPTAAKLLGTTFFLLLIRAAYVLGLYFGGTSSARALTILAAAAPQLGFWASAGLETLSVAYFLASGLMHAITCSTRGRISNWLVSIACLLTVSRPEGLALAGILIFYASHKHLRVLPNQLRLLVFLLFVATAHIARYAYFGELLPHTFYVKSGSLATNVFSGCSYLLMVLISAGGVAIPLAIFVERNGNPSGKFLLVILLGFYVTFQLRFGWDWMPHARMAVPYLAPALVPYVGMVTRLGQGHGMSPGVAVMALWLVAWGGHAMKEGYIVSSFRGTDHHPYREMGRFLSERFSEEDLFVYDEMGVLPFHGKVRFLDMNGLADKTIGKSKYANPSRAGHLEFVFNRVRQSRPKGIILYTPEPPDSDLFLSRQPRPWAARLTTSQWFRDTYEHRISFQDTHLFIIRDEHQRPAGKTF